MDAATEALFSYGTLQDPTVQQATFGRLLQGEAAALEGYAMSSIAIRDADVVATSGEARHPIIVASGRAEDRVAGTLFLITPAELAHADAYEVDDYVRVSVILTSGRRAWAYVQPD